MIIALQGYNARQGIVNTPSKSGKRKSSSKSSPAKRANKTADIIAKKSGYDKKILESNILYAATIENYIDVIQNIKNENKIVLLVGHNPTIEDVVERIIGQRYVMKTCSLANIELSIDSWGKFDYGVECKLIDFIHAREL